MMRIGLIGDVHGRPEWALRQIELAQPDFCIQVGDYWAYDQEWPVPVHWIFGNHEQRDVAFAITAGVFPLPNNSIWQPGGEIVAIGGLNVVFLPAKIRIDPSPGPAGYEEGIWRKCLALAGQKVDLLVSHGCAFPFEVWLGARKIQCEESGITLLARRLRPRAAVSGHNHENAKEEHEGIACLRLGSASVSHGGFRILEIDNDTGRDQSEVGQAAGEEAEVRGENQAGATEDEISSGAV